MSTRPRLDATLLNVLDLGDQPKGLYIFVVEGLLGPRQAFSIDGWSITDGYVEAYRNVTLTYINGGTARVIRHTVIVVPAHAPWAIVRRDDVLLSTVTESIRKRKADDVGETSLMKELYPERHGGTATEEVPGPVPLPRLGHYL